jgi:hypothetical protein
MKALQLRRSTLEIVSLSTSTNCWTLVLTACDWTQRNVRQTRYFHSSRERNENSSTDIAASDLENISSRFIKKPYITQEVVYNGGPGVHPEEYTGLGDVQECVNLAQSDRPQL